LLAGDVVEARVDAREDPAQTRFLAGCREARELALDAR
jgi:hypothetical protein